MQVWFNHYYLKFRISCNFGNLIEFFMSNVFTLVEDIQ